jgi:hypothetical protein
LFGGGVAAGAPVPGAAVPAPTAGAPVAGPSGVTAVPPGEIDSPVALVPPVDTGGPAGTFGAPGSDELGDSVRGDGVVKDGTVKDARGMPTVSADGVPTGAKGFAGALPSDGAVLALEAPVGAGTLAVEDVPGATAVAVGAAVAAAELAPAALPVTLPAPAPDGANGCDCMDGVVAPICASATGA